MSWRKSVPIVLLALAPSCEGDRDALPPAGYHTVTIDTDAVLPVTRVGGAAVETPPLFDRLELTVLTGDSNDPRPEDVRVIDVTTETFSRTGRGATFIIARDVPPSLAGDAFDLGDAESTRGPRVRARLFRGASVLEGIVRPETAIEVWARLPQTPATGEVETTIYLLTDDVGSPRGAADDPVAPSEGPLARVVRGAPKTTRVGTWAGATRTACREPTQGDRICVPGGAFWMGNPIVKGTDFVESDRQRLVVLRPFYVDPREVTVRELREWMVRTNVTAGVTERDRDDPTRPAHFCTFTREPSEHDDRPVNCLDWATAKGYCADHGGTLLSESQFEYVSGALRSALYIWGSDEAAICEAAVWGRGGRSGTAIASVGSDNCLPARAADDGPRPLDATSAEESRVTDRIDLPGGTIFDLAGNLQEWQSDYFAGQDNPCWTRPNGNVFYDPLCADGGVAGERSVRGGSWLQDRAFLRAAYRSRRSASQAALYDVGFRCAQVDPEQLDSE